MSKDDGYLSPEEEAQLERHMAGRKEPTASKKRADKRPAIVAASTAPRPTIVDVGELTPPVDHAEGTAAHSDVANADRLVAWHGHNLRFCDDLGGWHAWDGRRWAQDNNAAWSAAEDTARRMLALAISTGDKDLKKHAEASQNVGRIDAMLRAASHRREVACLASDFDAHPWRLNVANGTLDLRTGLLSPHDRRELHRKLAPVEWQGLDATNEILDRFLDFACEPHEGLRDFLARMTGLALVGANPYEAFFVVHGHANTGKSTWNEALLAMLGDYAVTSAVETFLANDSRRTSGAEPSPDIARLAGTRLVLCSETREDAKLDETLVKRATSDTMVGRFLNKNPFEFKITFKVVMACNSPPRVSHRERAIWRRLHLVPLNRVVPEADRDPEVKAAMSNPAIVGPALLAMAVRGCLQHQELKGLAPPPCVREATKAYRDAQDPLRDFVADRCVVFPSAEPPPEQFDARVEACILASCWATTSDLRRAYEAWAKEQGQEVLVSPKSFGAALSARGCVVKPLWLGGTTARVWYGIRLRTAADALTATHAHEAH